MPPNTTYPAETYARNRKILLILSLIGAVGLIIAGIILVIINAQKTATLNIIVAPTTATVTVDGHQFKTNETINYYPGTYNADISAAGFIAQSLSLDLTPNQESYLYVVLEPTAENADYYEQNPTEANRRQLVYDSNYQAESDSYAAQYPIVAILPYDHHSEDRFGNPTGYHIDYGQFDDCDSKFCLQVTSYTKSGLELAKSYIESKGFNPDDYQILFNYQPLQKPKPEDFPENIRKIMEDAGYFDE